MSQSTYKTVEVIAGMGVLKKKVQKKRQVGVKKVTKTKGLFNKESYEVEEPVLEEYEEWVPTGQLSDIHIDHEGFSRSIMEACNLLASEGYEVVHISDIVRGAYNVANGESIRRTGIGIMDKEVAGGWGYGYGYSVTSGAIITAKLVKA